MTAPKEDLPELPEEIDYLISDYGMVPEQQDSNEERCNLVNAIRRAIAHGTPQQRAAVAWAEAIQAYRRDPSTGSALRAAENAYLVLRGDAKPIGEPTLPVEPANDLAAREQAQGEGMK